MEVRGLSSPVGVCSAAILPPTDIKYGPLAFLRANPISLLRRRPSDWSIASLYLGDRFMIELLDRIDIESHTPASLHRHSPSLASPTSPAQQLRSITAAVRLSFTWLGTQKSLTAQQRAQAAEAFDAESQFLSAGKKLLDLKHPAFRAV